MAHYSYRNMLVMLFNAAWYNWCMQTTVYGRTLVGDSLGFHILFALLGVGIPLLMLGAEYLALRRHDERWLRTLRLGRGCWWCCLWPGP